MRILQLAQFLPPVAGGEERHVWNLSAALASLSHDVTLLGFAAGAQPPGETWADGVRVVRVRSTGSRLPLLYSDPERPHALPVPDPAISRAIAHELATERYDVVHAHNWIVNSALRPAAHAGVPVVMTQHDYSHLCATKRMMERGVNPCPGPSPARCLPCSAGHYGTVSGTITAVANAWSGRRRAKLITTAVAVSSPVAEVAESATGRWTGQNRLRARVVPNFIPDDLVVDEIAVPAPDAPFLYVGDLSRDKGVHILLEAFDTLDGASSLILAGRSVDTAASRLSPAARWVGELPHEDVLRLYRSARGVIVPSVWPDPCPTVVLEAMAAGRPVVAAASGGIVDLVDHGRTGILIPPGDSVALARALGAIIDDPVTAAAMGAAGRDRVRSFTVSSVVRSIEEIYAECADRRSVGIHR